MYGWEDVRSDIIGMEYSILFKYYLADNLAALQALVQSGGDVRWVDVTKSEGGIINVDKIIDEVM